MRPLEVIFHIAELLAAITGTFYITKYRINNVIRYFVYFLWITVFIENIGNLPRFIDKWDSISFLKGSFLEKNAWLYNVYSIFSYCVYFIFFKLNLSSRLNRKILDIMIILFVISCVLNLIFSGVFFKTHSSFIMILGTLLLLFTIVLYFFQILQSDEILNFGRSIVFYIAVGALIMHLSITPFFIYFRFFSMEKSPEFVKIYTLIIPSAIIFTYTCYTIGFIICSPQKKIYQKNKSY